MLENLSQLGALLIMFVVLVVGEVISRITRGKVPSALVITFLMLAGFWTIFPKDIVARTGINAQLYALSAMLLVINLSTLISRKEMQSQWRTIIINLLGLAGICGITLTLSAKIFGWQNAIAAAPPLAGGVIATAMMQQAASAKGLEMAALIALICFVMQGIFGYPLTSFFLSREAKRLNKLYTEGKLAGEKTGDEAAEKAGSVFTKLKSASFILLKLTVVALLSYWVELGISKVTGGKFTVSRYVWCLVLGFVASEFKMLEKDALSQSNSYGLLLNILLIYLFGSLNMATPNMFWTVAWYCAGFVVIAALAMALMAFIASKIFKSNTFAMCYSIILTAFYGFPINVMLTNEAVEGVSSDKDARRVISSHIMPKMLVGGFTSVTIVSVVIAGILMGKL
ncbi:MAG: hypothetical protein LBG07_02630 [Treponema sp.]|jgi:hypothetical protein|nr:hypothetical protein [Treponema sp.]